MSYDTTRLLLSTKEYSFALHRTNDVNRLTSLTLKRPYFIIYKYNWWGRDCACLKFRLSDGMAGVENALSLRRLRSLPNELTSVTSTLKRWARPRNSTSANCAVRASTKRPTSSPTWPTPTPTTKGRTPSISVTSAQSTWSRPTVTESTCEMFTGWESGVTSAINSTVRKTHLAFTNETATASTLKSWEIPPPPLLVMGRRYRLRSLICWYDVQCSRVLRHYCLRQPKLRVAVIMK